MFQMFIAIFSGKKQKEQIKWALQSVYFAVSSKKYFNAFNWRSQNISISAADKQTHKKY